LRVANLLTPAPSSTLSRQDEKHNAVKHPGPSLAQPNVSLMLATVSLFRVNVVARNPKDETQATPPLEVLVDTGSELTWLPAEALARIGITPRRKRTCVTATKQTVTREVGYAILSADGYETADEVVFAQPGDLTLLGVRTIEGFGVAVDSVGHRFVAQTTIVACELE
jgi:predicted aspartyl protease